MTAANHGLVALRKLIVGTAATPDPTDPDGEAWTVLIDDVTADRIAAAVLAFAALAQLVPAPVETETEWAVDWAEDGRHGYEDGTEDYVRHVVALYPGQATVVSCTVTRSPWVSA